MTSPKIPRRRFLQLAAGAVAAPAIIRPSWAQGAYPNRTVRTIVPVPPAGPPDMIARLIGPTLHAKLGQPFIVENKPGGGTNVGIELLARSEPDGYTLGIINHSSSINMTLVEKMNFNFVEDIVGIANVMQQPNALVVHPDMPMKTVPEFIAYVKANPGKINYASAGMGSTSHISAELFKTMTGVDMSHIPYPGGAQAMTDLLAGRVHLTFNAVPTIMSQLQSGRLRALGITSKTRIELLPDVPPIADFVPGFEAIGWYGYGAPKKTPPEIVELLHREIYAALEEPNIKKRISDLGATVTKMSIPEFNKFMADDVDKWAKVIKAANIPRR